MKPSRLREGGSLDHLIRQPILRALVHDWIEWNRPSVANAHLHSTHQEATQEQGASEEAQSIRLPRQTG